MHCKEYLVLETHSIYIFPTREVEECIEVVTWLDRRKRGVATHLSCVNARYSSSRVNRAWRVELDFLGSLEDRKGTRRRISVASPPAQKSSIIYFNDRSKIITCK